MDTVGLYNPGTSIFYLRNANSTGVADVTFAYGPAGSGWTPIVGDWNADSIDTVGLYNPGAANFYLRNTNNTGVADVTFMYGPAGGGWSPIAGDWDGDDIDTVGLYDPGVSNFYLRNTNNTGVADVTFNYGSAGGSTPIVGDWDGPGGPLTAADGRAATTANVATLTQGDLQPIVGEAIDRWAVAGLDDAMLAKLRQVEFVIGDLPGAYLGEALTDRITIDRDAAGHGWFVDSTPAVDEEFTSLPSDGRLLAIDPRAVDRIDLLTVVEHELGHIAGFDDLDDLADDLMSRALASGVRRDP